MGRDGLMDLVQTLDKETMNSCQNVGMLMKEFLIFSGREAPYLIDAASIHDVGKMYISSRILFKEDRLTASEMQIVKLHPYMGWLIAKEYGIADDVAEIILFHHGSHPSHLQTIPEPNERVLEDGRILYTFDAFHAMTSERCYRQAMDPRVALEVMAEECHRQMIFDSIAMEFLRTRMLFG